MTELRTGFFFCIYEINSRMLLVLSHKYPLSLNEANECLVFNEYVMNVPMRHHRSIHVTDRVKFFPGGQTDCLYLSISVWIQTLRYPPTLELSTNLSGVSECVEKSPTMEIRTLMYGLVSKDPQSHLSVMIFADRLPNFMSTFLV